MKRGKEYEMKNYTTLTLIMCLPLVLRMNAQQTATPEPYSIKADKLGEIAADWLANDPTHKDWTCGDASHIAEGKTIGCGRLGWAGKDTYAGALLSSQSVSFVAKDSKLILYRIEMDLWNDLYLSGILPALQEKFGTPAAHEVTPLQNALGAKFERNTWKWTNGISSVELVYALGAPDDVPILSFTLDGPAKEVKEREEKEKKNAAKKDM
jgi:hypothetical protein